MEFVMDTLNGAKLDPENKNTIGSSNLNPGPATKFKPKSATWKSPVFGPGYKKE